MKVSKLTPVKAKNQRGKMSCTYAEKKLNEAIKKLNREQGLAMGMSEKQINKIGKWR